MKIDEQWNLIFKKYNIIEEIQKNNKFILEADNIKECKDSIVCNKKESI